MSLTWRVLLVWLMACALPLQGLAAVRMQHCAPSHPAVTILQTVATPAHAARADHGPGQGGGHHAGGHHDSVHDAHHAAPDTAPAHGAQPAQDGGTGSCSACAACCAALALFAQVPGLPASPPDALVPQRAPLESASFFSDGLDRPPRLPRA
ncbi:hypothetical protein ACPOLB_00995 [Rubrivivax sp. RP6-9]|uniref:hypothetical protein n=1 Tax=Rubrivivax sp. RP6-9 TaxID=3415750 RepID=UPI003CC5A8DD